MHLSAHAFVAVVDGTNFTLFRNEGTAESPSLKAHSLPVDGASAHHAGQGDTPRQNAEAGHAAAVAEALNAAVLANTIKSLVIIADPSTLGEMRKLYHKQLESVLEGELPKTLTGRDADDIAKAVAAA